jgi:hypothetical protein
MELGNWMTSCHRKVVDENLPKWRSGCPSAVVVDDEMAAEMMLQTNATSASR